MSSYVYHIILLDIDLYDLILFYQIILFNHILSLLYLILFYFLSIALSSVLYHFIAYKHDSSHVMLYITSLYWCTLLIEREVFIYIPIFISKQFLYFFASFRIILQGRQWEGHPSTEKGARKEARKYMYRLLLIRSIFFSFLSISIPIRTFYLTKITLSFLFWTQ